MQKIGFSLDIYRRLLSIQIRSQMQYKVAFIFELLTVMFTSILFFVSFALIFQRFGRLGGWTLGEVAFLWGLVDLSFRSMDLVFSGFDPDRFGPLVRQGTFDQILLRPVNVTVQIFGSTFILRRVGEILQGAAILLFALSLIDIHWTLFKLFYLALVILGLIGFFGGLFMIGSTVTFWTIESIEAVNILTYGGREMISYPMHIYPDWLRRTFTYIVPAIFLNFYPALFFLDKPDPLGLPSFAPFLAPVVGVGTFMLALVFWRFGITHYQSTGS